MTDVTTVKRRLLRLRVVRGTRACVDLFALWRTLSRSVLVDGDEYARQRGRRNGSRSVSAAHWLMRGEPEGLLLGALLIPPVGLNEKRVGALRRAYTLRRAGFPRHTAHPLFDAKWYISQRPDAASFRGGPLAHWTLRGRPDGVPTSPELPVMVDLIALASEAIADDASMPSAPDPSPVELVVVLSTRWPLGGEALASARHVGAVDEAGDVVEPPAALVVTSDGSPIGRVVAAALAELPRTRVVRAIGADLLTELEAQGDPDDAVLVVRAPVEFDQMTAEQLLQALTQTLVHDAVTDASGPLLLARDGTVAAAGNTITGDAIGAGLSPDDIRRDGTHVVDGLPGDVLALRRRHLSAALSTGSDWTFRDGTTRMVLVPAATARRLTPDHASASVHAVEVHPPRPVQVAESPPRLRWAIKSPHPVGTAGLAWGDLHFARSLAEALERQGQFAVVDPLDAWYRESGRDDDVAIVLRGLHRFTPRAGQPAALWVISHPELVSDDELADFPLVLAASESWAHAHSVMGRTVQPLLQCTDAHLFRPDVGLRGGGASLLFVGNTRSARRPIVEAAVEARLPLKVVGSGWAGRLPSDALLTERVDNADLPALYRSADVVLNDHWPQMARAGFLSNRLFDLTAVGVAWVSDPATGIDAVFPDVARVAGNAAQLRQIIEGAPQSLPDEQTLLRASERIRIEHSFDARASALIEHMARARSAPSTVR
jgi:hypothetical protein